MANHLSDYLKKGFVLRNGVLLRIVQEDKRGKVQGNDKKRPISDAGTQKRGSGILVLPYPPSVNKLYGTNRQTGQKFLGREGREFQTEVRRITDALGIVPLEGPVIFTMWLYRPRKVGDLMNREKVICDSLNGIAYQDDSQIVEFHAYRYDDPKNPRVEIKVSPQE